MSRPRHRASTRRRLCARSATVARDGVRERPAGQGERRRRAERASRLAHERRAPGGQAGTQAADARLAAGRARPGQRRRPPARGDRLAGLAPCARRGPGATVQPAPAPPAPRTSTPRRLRRGGRVASGLSPDSGRRAGCDPDQLGLDGQGRRRVPRRARARGDEEADGARRAQDAHPDAVRRGDPGARRRARQGSADRPLRGRDDRRAGVRGRRRGSSSSGRRS